MKEPSVETQRVSRGASIGRYVVLRWVGSGAMGHVYSAYDPDLDRKLAIKLVRAKEGDSIGGGDGKSRLLREAQAIAKLSHPNVIVVHDVGTFQDRVFIAMEFIEGGTLNFWLHAQARPWREILKVFIAAGRGLQHAHNANLVHRDFKPDNVMVRVDGEVRVMDFGLVRYTDTGESGLDSQPGNSPAGGEPAEYAGALDATIDLARSTAVRLPPPAQPVNTKLTQTGTTLGTPAYMAPEQFVGQTVDARTDQFSFCVALYEALYGTRPFEGSTISELTGSVLGGRIKAPPQRSQVPIAVWRALRQGLAVSPADRYPSMTDLLADLERQRDTGRRNATIGAAAGFALLVALVGGLTWREMDRRSLCAEPTERFEGVWELSARSGSRRAAIEVGFRNAGRPNAKHISTGRSSSWAWANDRNRVSFGSVSSILDRYVSGWLTTYKDACEATNYRGDQSAQVLDLRMSCLSDRFNQVRSLSDMLVTPTEAVVEGAAQAAASLRSLDECSNVAVLRLGSGPNPSE